MRPEWSLVSELVTGEAVIVELQLAKLPSRAIGFAIDAAVQIALAVGMLVLAGALAGAADAALVATVGVAGIILIFIALPATVETLTRGRSLGKLAMGLRAVRDDGGAVQFRHALVRAVAGFVVDFWILGWLGAGVLISLASARGKRLGDYLAGTVVIRERIPVRGGPAATMPASLAQWARGLDLSRIPSDLVLAVRQYVSRADQLAPDVRDTMARQLAAEVAAHVGGTIPVGVPASVYLSAVLAERRNRELARTAPLAAQPVVTPAAHTEPNKELPHPTANHDNPFAPPR